MLEIHFGRHLQGSLLDRSIEDASQEEIVPRRSKPCLDWKDHLDKRASEKEPPTFFTNALHLAVEYHAVDVMRLLLISGFDPNGPGVSPSLFEHWKKDNCSVSNQFLSPANNIRASTSSSSGSKTYVTSNQCLNVGLRTVYETPEGKPVLFDDHYSREGLFVLAPIFLAIAIGDARVVQLLLRYGASPNIQDEYGVTPLHIATCQQRLSYTCIRLLLERGAKIEIPNKRGVRPLQLMEQDLRILQKSLVDDAFSCFLAHPVARLDGEATFLSTGNNFRNYFLMKRFQDNKSHSRQSSKTKEIESICNESTSSNIPRSSLEISSEILEGEISEKVSVHLKISKF